MFLNDSLSSETSRKTVKLRATCGGRLGPGLAYLCLTVDHIFGSCGDMQVNTRFIAVVALLWHEVPLVHASDDGVTIRQIAADHELQRSRVNRSVHAMRRHRQDTEKSTREIVLPQADVSVVVRITKMTHSRSLLGGPSSNKARRAIADGKLEGLMHELGLEPCKHYALVGHQFQLALDQDTFPLDEHGNNPLLDQLKARLDQLYPDATDGIADRGLLTLERIRRTFDLSENVKLSHAASTLLRRKLVTDLGNGKTRAFGEADAEVLALLAGFASLTELGVVHAHIGPLWRAIQQHGPSKLGEMPLAYWFAPGLVGLYISPDEQTLNRLHQMHREVAKDTSLVTEPQYAIALPPDIEQRARQTLEQRMIERKRKANAATSALLTKADEERHSDNPDHPKTLSVGDLDQLLGR